MELTIRGQKHSIDRFSELQILPLAKIFNKIAPEEDSPQYERWSAEVGSVFAEPNNQAAVAYVITSLIPNIDPAIARYKIKRFDEGYSEIDFVLAIDLKELLQVIEAISPMLNIKVNDIKKLNQSRGKGFAPTSAPKTIPADDGAETRIKELEAELAQLKSAV
jgi:hypothetical protein